jgi:tetratricopeptide (TPR) repeat protein
MSDREDQHPDEHPTPGDEPVAAETASESTAEAAAAADEPEPYQRRVAVVLALLAVIGAWIGIMHSDASTSESFYARETTRTAVSSLSANVNQSTVQGLEVDLDAESAALSLTSPFRDDGTGLAALTDEQETSAQLESDLDVAEADIGGLDREQLARDQTLAAERLDLKRKALAETRVTYNNRASQYETVLTTLGVALFLVGFTLVLRRRTRPPILVPGVLLAVYVAGWALWIHHRDVPNTPDEAIEAAAEGATELAFGDPSAAVERYDAAIELDDDFVPAHRGRSFASFQAANPDFTSTLAVVDTDGDDADQARADIEQALQLGQDDGQSLILAGAYAFYDGDFTTAIDRFEAAIDANGEVVEAYALLGAAQLAAGDDEAATESITTVRDLLDPSEASTETRQVAADLFSFLEVVADAVPEQAEAVATVQEAVVAAEGELVFGERPSGELPSAGSVNLDRLELVDDDQVALELSYTDLPEDTDVQLYLYEQPAEGASYVQAPELARFAQLAGSDVVAGTATVDRHCTPVAFRLDVYLDGALAERFDAPGGTATC